MESITLGNIGRSSVGNKLFSLGCCLSDFSTFHQGARCLQRDDNLLVLLVPE